VAVDHLPWLALKHSARHQTDVGRIGTELIIHGQCDTKFIFGQAVDCLPLEVDINTRQGGLDGARPGH